LNPNQLNDLFVTLAGRDLSETQQKLTVDAATELNKAKDLVVNESVTQAQVDSQTVALENSISFLNKSLEAKKVELLGADYIGSGAIFGTNTKDNAKKLEMGELKKIVASVKIPVFAIGGININNVSILKNIGLQGICSVSGILSEKDCKKAVELMLKNFN